MTTELDDLRDEVIYLKVKLRKERSLARAEYTDVRDRIDDLRAEATDTHSAASHAPSAALPPVTQAPSAGTTPRSSAPATETRSTVPAGMTEIPSGTELDVRLRDSLNSGTAQVEQRFEAPRSAI